MRYRLRTLLILISIIAAYFGGRASLQPTVREQVKRIDDLEKETIEQRRRLNEGFHYRLFACPSDPAGASKPGKS